MDERGHPEVDALVASVADGAPALGCSYATDHHLLYVIRHCYLPPDTCERTPLLTPAKEAATRFTYDGGMEA